MITFLHLFLFRVLSGVQNGIGYAHLSKQTAIAITSILLAFATILPFFIFNIKGLSTIGIVAAMAGIVISIVGNMGVYDNFTKSLGIFPQDIHLWELLLTGGVSVCWIALGGNLYLIAAHVYPALLLHKAAVNIGSGLPFWDHRTDDATGQTYNIPLLNLRIPRLSLRGRQIIAVVSIVGAAVVWWQEWTLSIYKLIP